MPLYLCQPGTDKPEPWRHGVSVYSMPFVRAAAAPSDAAEERPLRRLRHGEIVLVDDVCLAWDCYWLRLRWPGHRGGFAGYLPIEKSDSDRSNSNDKADDSGNGEFLMRKNHTCVGFAK